MFALGAIYFLLIEVARTFILSFIVSGCVVSDKILISRLRHAVSIDTKILVILYLFSASSGGNLRIFRILMLLISFLLIRILDVSRTPT